MYLMPDVTREELIRIAAVLEAHRNGASPEIVARAADDLGLVLASLVHENEGFVMDESSRQGPPPGEYYQGIKYPD